MRVLIFVLALLFLQTRTSEGLTIGDVITNVPTMADFHTQVAVFRSPHTNIFWVNDSMEGYQAYELRMFAFYMGPNLCSVFGMYVEATGLNNTVLTPTVDPQAILQPLSYYNITSDLYLILSVLPYKHNHCR